MKTRTLSASLSTRWLLPTLLMGAALLQPPLQAQEAGWSFHFDPGALGNLEPYELKMAPDGGALVLGRSELPGSTAAYVLVKFSENGDRAWSHTVEYQVSSPGSSPFLEDSAAVDVDPDGNILLVTNDRQNGLVTKLASSGAIQWRSTLGLLGSFEILQYTDIDASVSGQVVVSGVRITSAPISLPFDDVVMLRASDGTIRWRKTATGASTRDQGVLTSVSRGPSGEILLTGQTDVIGYPFHPRVVVMNSNGGVLWHESLQRPAYANHTTDDAVIDAAGQVTILSSPSSGGISSVRLTRLDAGGMELFDVVRGSSRGRDLLLHPNGETWIAGAASRSPAILRFNGAGQFIASSGVGAAAGQGGELNRLAINAQGTVHAVGTREAGSPTDLTLLAAFAANGLELHSQALEGMPPILTDERVGSVDLGLDDRGNPLTLAQSISAASGDLQLIATKTIEGGSTGTRYCGPAVTNSTGLPASLDLVGTTDVGSNNLSLRVSALPISTFVLLLASRTQGFAPQAGGGQGTLCLGGAIGRYVAPGQVRISSAQGAAYLQLELTTMPQPTGLVLASPGETWNFQAWYRDGNPSITSNLSNGVSVVLQ